MFRKILTKLLITTTIFSAPIAINSNIALAATKSTAATIQNTNKYEIAKVARVVDGDTIELTNGEKVRLIGVNSPEDTTKKEFFGKEATAYTKSKLTGKTIYLEKDKSNTDMYNRLLRYVWLQKPTNNSSESEIKSKLFNADLVIKGYAKSDKFYPDVKYSSFFDKYMKEAMAKKTGMWTPTYSSYKATLSNYSPKQNTDLILNVSGQNGKNYTAKIKYKSKNTYYNGTIGTPLKFSIARATIGYKVVIEVYVDGKLTTTTSFTPSP